MFEITFVFCNLENKHFLFSQGQGRLCMCGEWPKVCIKDVCGLGVRGRERLGQAETKKYR